MTKTIELVGRVDDRHQLTAQVPENVPSGLVRLAILVELSESGTENEDDADSLWAAGVAREWEDELADPTQDVYSLSDGEPVDEAR